MNKWKHGHIVSYYLFVISYILLLAYNEFSINDLKTIVTLTTISAVYSLFAYNYSTVAIYLVFLFFFVLLGTSFGEFLLVVPIVLTLISITTALLIILLKTLYIKFCFKR